ncbi:MAG: methyltransferase domain-containing protein [Chloroflexi bacterium]|nr:methyltransferase domain-containing protein [Chloroflexota bacterium]
MKKTTWLGLIAGAATGAKIAFFWSRYQRRTIERIPSLEGLDDPAVARAYGRIMTMPQMALLRRYVAQRAVAMKSAGAAADIGCGPGDLVIGLARLAPGLHVTGVDLSEEMLSQGKERAAWAGVRGRVKFRQGAAGQIPVADASLDLVVSTLSLHHWGDPVAALSEISRVLRPGAAFLIFDLRRDLAFPLWSLIYFATHVVVPRALRHIGEPLGSRNAAYTPAEAASLASASKLTGWRVTAGPLWLTIEGTTDDH